MTLSTLYSMMAFMFLVGTAVGGQAPLIPAGISVPRLQPQTSGLSSSEVTAFLGTWRYVSLKA